MEIAMFKKPFLLFLILLLAACGQGPTPNPTPSEQLLATEEQNVYAAVLKEMYGAQLYVIMDTPAIGPGGSGDIDQMLQYVLNNLHNVDPATTDSFRVRNATAVAVHSDMSLGTNYILLSQAVRSQIFGQNQDGWQLFYEKYPDAPGITSLSQVGFNVTLDQALVYVGTLSHYLAGAGYYILLKKVNGTWTIDQQVMTWIS
jgi:hypothetical protein